ncbi:MAG: hypothetical protein Q4A16_02265 [Lautropia sp.]|nr:hypothetical protein [Lautropia sp.]
MSPSAAVSRPVVTSLSLALALLISGCATTDTVPPELLLPEPVQTISRTDPAGEPYYLDYRVGDIGLEYAFDDGSHTFVEFSRPVPSELSCFDQQGALLGCEAVGQVLAVQGVHSGVLLRLGEAAGFIAPNPKAQPAPLRQLTPSAEWAPHIQARNRLLLKAPLREALSRSAGVPANPDINQAAGLTAVRTAPAQAVSPETGAKKTTKRRQKDRLRPQDTAPRSSVGLHHPGWLVLPFGQNSAQLDPGHPALARLLARARQADEIRIDARNGAPAGDDPRQQLLTQARLQAVRQLLNSHGVATDRVRVVHRAASGLPGQAHLETAGGGNRNRSANGQSPSPASAPEPPPRILLLRRGQALSS